MLYTKFNRLIPEYFSKLLRSKFTALSVAQIAGLVIVTLAGTGIWFIVAAVSRPEDVGILGRVISTSTFTAGLITAGLGQFILTIIRTSSRSQLQRYFWWSIGAGGMLSALIAGTIGLIQEGVIDQVVIATGILSSGIAITNLQDAIYLGTGLPYDVPAKGAGILIARLVILLCMIFIKINLTTLLFTFVLSQTVIAVAWIIIRAPEGLKQHIYQEANVGGKIQAWSALSISYLYSIAITSISTGVPMIVTTIITPITAGVFYMAWVLAGLFGSVSVSVANSILAISLGQRDMSRRLIKILIAQTIVLFTGGLLISFLLPPILSIFNQHYSDLSELFRALAVGQLFFGVSVVVLAAYRSIILNRSLVSILILWPVVILLCVYVGLLKGNIEGGIIGFIAGNIIISIPICLLSFRTVINIERIHSNLIEQGINS